MPSNLTNIKNFLFGLENQIGRYPMPVCVHLMFFVLGGLKELQIQILDLDQVWPKDPDSKVSQLLPQKYV